MNIAYRASVPALDGFEGELITPHDAGYDRARRIWNGSIDRRPAFIARCRSTADVAAAVVFARRHGLPIAVRGGGHSIPGYSVVEGGLMIDCSPMKGIELHPEVQRADVDPGVLWREFDTAAQAEGLATPGGEISDTGVAGLTLGGGIGWLSRLYGLAADNLLGVELVTSTGDVVTADDSTDPELMWGLRGGGGNFGIVTRFTFRLHSVAPAWAGMVMYPGALAQDALHAFHEVGERAPRELSLVAALVSAPPAPFVPADAVGKPVVGIAAAYFGPRHIGQELTAPLRSLGRPLIDTFGIMGYADLQRMFDDANVPGRQQYVRSDFLQGLPDEAIAALFHHGTRPSSPLNQVLLRRLGGAIGDRDRGATAFGHRSADYMTMIAATWENPAEDSGLHRRWVGETWNATRPWADGTYVNHLGDEGSGRIREAYLPDSWSRLTRLKARMDPDNVFALNQNIPPAGA
ncbi:FAD-binding oxidoreductase [Microtetraspora sp. NBRC 16547]|uniref:FAD-binding oxidoreductase n=1 Tax=Microtetraspora sp. NBRC 16547 TaxID=3030993 RepID=UPI0024A1915D|nr:FAD-binding oxidoreductase [Microtetraspora sp. NBRC 16547]GLX01425.1 FAD-linked oxidase [Microtetraspora sp. NBRC 16547]